MGAVKNFYHDEICTRDDDGPDEEYAMSVAPPAYQAEALRGQICDDVNRRFWRARQRIVSAFEGRKDQVQHDYEKLQADQFLAKYEGWRFL